MPIRKLALAAKPGRNILAVVVLMFALTLVPVGQATDGRDFAGFYEVSNVTDLGDTVRLTLAVRIFNYSDADVTNATVTLQDSLQADTDYGSYPGPTSIANCESARFSTDFTVPRAEYERWQNGGTPPLRIQYSDSVGSAVQRMIELAAGPAREE